MPQILSVAMTKYVRSEVHRLKTENKGREGRVLARWYLMCELCKSLICVALYILRDLSDS